jgi:ribosomal protein S18 acetylase RimI-like enzyme
MQFDFNTEFDAPTPSADYLVGRYRELLADDAVVVLLAGGGETTGYAFLTLRPSPFYDGPVAQLEELYVRPDRRDQRIGSALLDHAIALLRERDVGEVHINVDEVDTDTRRFYEQRFGFVNIEPGTDYRMLCYIREL